ncbi:leucine-rich repeat-containing G-protein coupled receptor 5-like [Haliotis rubra]|uniref:leucine-rich repeat-containing G-protein coupled receptor 5-like n=1 Tax=Haliotis rubra TaxID=36100 RepID=UPI001EE518BD|nr:leucine-rich repeat-containing G-protein coupled receptor 5-like [Haliotis rubra]
MMKGLLTVMLLVLVIREALTSIPCHVSYHKDGAHVDCRNRSLTRVPNNLPGNTSYLDLSFNNITTLNNYSFNGLANVEKLLLESSGIRVLEVNSFKGLSSLMELSLSYNNLPPSAYPIGVFRRLLKLTRLKLQDDLRTTEVISFPDKALADLVNLKELWLASPPEPVFGPGFAKLRHLECLYFNTRACQLTTLRNGTFQSFKDTPLRKLYITGCLLTTLEAGTFENLPHLRVLYIKKARSIGLKPALRSLYGLVGKTMSLITFSAVGLGMGENSMSKLKNNETLVLTKGMMTYLNQICVEKIDLSQNRIVMVEADALDLCDTCSLKKCLKYLDASGNMIVGELSVAGKLLFFGELEVMDVSYPAVSYHGAQRRKLLSAHAHAPTDLKAKPSLMILLPPSIRSLNVSGTYLYGRLSAHFSSMHIISHNPNFTELVAEDSDILEGIRLYGAATLKSLDLSGADLRYIPSDMFHSLLNLEVLKLKDTKLDLTRSDYQTLFEPLTQLTYLDLSGNMKPYINENIFTNLSSVTHLRLSNNGLTDIPSSVKCLTRLQHLDLSDNLISQFQPSTRQSLDDIQQLSPRLRVSLRGNTLACGCNSVAFIEWLMMTDVVFDDVQMYRCIDEAGTLGPLMLDWTHLQHPLA